MRPVAVLSVDHPSSYLLDYRLPTSTEMAPSILSEHVKNLSLDFQKTGVEAQMTSFTFPSKVEDSDTPHIERMSTPKTENDYHESYSTSNTMEFLDSDDPVVIVGMGE